MSAPPIGMIMSTPSEKRNAGDQPEIHLALRYEEPVDEEDERRGERNVDDMARRQHDRLAAHASRQLQEGDHRAGESDGANRDAERHFDQARAVNVTVRADVESRRRIERSGRHQHRRHADKGVKGRDQFRHRRHRYAAGNHGADAAADSDAADHKSPGKRTRRRMRAERRQHGDGHADHAEQVAALARIRARQAAQRQNEQDAGDQIEQRDEVRAHVVAHFFFFWYIASMR